MAYINAVHAATIPYVVISVVASFAVALLVCHDNLSHCEFGLP